VRGRVDEHRLGKEVQLGQPEERDRTLLARLVGQFGRHFGCDAEEILSGDFVKLTPLSLRPYGRLYAD
jgi:hypothetical protein